MQKSGAGDEKLRQKTEIALREEEVLKFWQEHDIFKKSLEKPSPKGDYIFYDGPPFATGLPHYGHIVASVIKDAVPRYFTMCGYHVPRVWGWDCHGLPIENIVERELGFKHKKDILEYGVAKFNERCRERVLTYASEWEKIIPRIGRWADMQGAYRTMDKPFMESVWWVFKQLWDKGLVYEDYRSMHICPRCETTLSQQEVSEGYKEVKDIAVTVKFKLKNPAKLGLSGEVYLLAWTTTPWTLPGNVALAVGADIRYGVVKGEDGAVCLAAKTDGEWAGSDLAGLSYEPLFDYYARDTNLKNHEKGWQVYVADFVSTEAGTGVVHVAPAFGSDDWALLKKEGLPFVQHVRYDGTMKPEVKEFAGMEVKPRSDDDKIRLGTDIAILKNLQDRGLVFAKENITHPYPHCWRCDTPLLNYATSSWFVKVEEQKTRLLRNARHLYWSPGHLKEGRWGKWLEGARDWSISRQRFWASVMPLWVCRACGNKRVFGSAKELEEASGTAVNDLHKHVVDVIEVPCKCGGAMQRIPDVLDTWFDSGSMPYGERHYPFENKARFDRSFPAQFIAEGLDQTRAWFYYLHVLATALFNKPAFQNVIVNGIVLAEDGKKMSKKLQNYPDPMDVVERYGADALRLYLLSSPIMQAENLSFAERGVDEVAKKHLGRLQNVLSFYQLYTNKTGRSTESTHLLDRWILARLERLAVEMTAGFEAYRLDAAVRPLGEFIDDLSTWYVRRSRDRFKTDDDDKQDALKTLRHVLYTLACLMAPATPFFAEHLYFAVRQDQDAQSVHLASWPQEPARSPSFLSRLFGSAPAVREHALVEEMRQVRALASAALKERERAGIKIRQPLSVLKVHARLTPELSQILADEVNVKKVIHDPMLQTETLLDTGLTPELREEGWLRDALRAVQEWRKELGLTISDRPGLLVKTSEDAALYRKYREIFIAQTGLLSFEVKDVPAQDGAVREFERL
jgi:isoleucyl-tRNA synthetase